MAHVIFQVFRGRTSAASNAFDLVNFSSVKRPLQPVEELVKLKWEMEATEAESAFEPYLIKLDK